MVALSDGAQLVFALLERRLGAVALRQIQQRPASGPTGGGIRSAMADSNTSIRSPFFFTNW